MGGNQVRYSSDGIEAHQRQMLENEAVSRNVARLVSSRVMVKASTTPLGCARAHGKEWGATHRGRMSVECVIQFIACKHDGTIERDACKGT
eukprot:scaffold28513_cov32-Tisochrysis_lutea.AAC.2